MWGVFEPEIRRYGDVAAGFNPREDMVEFAALMRKLKLAATSLRLRACGSQVRVLSLQGGEYGKGKGEKKEAGE